MKAYHRDESGAEGPNWGREMGRNPNARMNTLSEDSIRFIASILG